MDYKYHIGDKVYCQKPLVLGQIKQLEAFMKNFIIPGDLNVITLMSILGDKIPSALAIVLIEEGKSLSDRFGLSVSPLKRGDQGVCNSGFGYEPILETMNQIALAIAINIDLETTAQVIEDFFACNPTASIFQRLSGIISSLGIPQSDPRPNLGRNPQSVVSKDKSPEAGLTNSASPSPEETSPDETTSSGDTPLPNASRILNTAPVT